MTGFAARRLVLLPLAAALSLIAGGCGGDDPAPQPVADAAGPDAASDSVEEGEVAAETTLTPLPRRTVEIYFPSTREDGLISELREIFATATPGDQVKQVVNDLLSGPTSDEAGRAVPGGTRLRQVYVVGDGVAWLDFTSELTDGLGGGSMAERLTVYSIVDSVVANVSQVSRVGILVDGRPVETLNGHLHLIKPLRPDFSLIRGSVSASGADPEEPTRLTEAAGAVGAAAD